LLASVIESPAGLAPEHHAARLRARWNVVLDAMSAEGWITRPARTAVTFPSVVARSNAGAPSGPSGFLLAFVEQELDHRFGYSLEALGRLHLTVVTTFDVSAQARAVRAVTAGRPSNRAVHVGVLSLDPRTGGIVAMFGGGAYAQPQFLNDATQVTAEVGHTLDGFTLAAALEGGLHVDGVWDAANGRLYDDGGRSLHRVPATGSPITLGAAVAFEKNAVVRTVEHLRQVGTTRVLGLARAAGASASVTLPRGSTADAGSVAATALDLATAYGTLVDDGMVARPTSVARIDDPDATVYRLAPERTRAVPAAVAQAVSAVLRTGPVVEPPPGTPLPSFGRPVVRVATTSGRRSSWFIGCTPELATAVVLVRPDPRGGPAHAMTPADLAATGNPLGRAAQIGVEVMAGR
jgi:membrane peptidoglycan carboxypeptidase